MAADWTDEENDAIVADYFAMLAKDLAGREYNKAGHNRALRETIDRKPGSVEFKHQNISAVLLGLGQPWINGYKPASNFQDSLIRAVIRRLGTSPAWASPMPTPASVQHNLTASAQDSPMLLLGVPPTFSNRPPDIDLDNMLGVARRFDVAVRDERNRALGRAGEQRVLAHEDAALRAAGRTDLARQIRWVSDLDGDGAGYDIASFEPDGTDRLIEVKTTNGWDRTPFFITRNELTVAEDRREHWTLMRIWNFARQPQAFELRPPLDAHVSLMATAWEARFA